MTHDLPTTVEWLDGTSRDYAGFDLEISGGVLTLTSPDSRTRVIPLEGVREVTAGGIVLVTT